MIPSFVFYSPISPWLCFFFFFFFSKNKLYRIWNRMKFEPPSGLNEMQKERKTEAGTGKEG